DDAWASAPPGEAPSRSLQPIAVEAEPVDDRLVAREPEEPRARIARLRPRHHAAEFHEAEPEGQKLIGNLALLVEAGGKPDRIGKMETEELEPEQRIVLGRV